MSVIDCPCGHRLETDDDEIRARVALDAYDG